MAFPLLPFVVFALVTTLTPGPNNVMVTASAANFGVRRTVPHIFGIAIGFGVMIVIAGIGLAEPLARFPRAQLALRIVGLGWLLLLAWNIATAPPPHSNEARTPLGFLGGAAFQWVNPKAWMIILGATGTYVSPAAAVLPQVALMGATFAVICLPGCLLWATFGAAAAPLLASPLRLRVFNVTMASLLILSLLPVVLE